MNYTFMEDEEYIIIDDIELFIEESDEDTIDDLRIFRQNKFLKVDGKEIF